MSDLPTLTAKQKGELLSAKARAKLETLAEVLRELAALGHGKIGKALANGAAKLSAAGYKMSASRLGHVLAAYRERGEFALIDHKLCGGCGLDGCTRTHGVTLLHAETVKHWLELMHENKARQTKGTIDGMASWKLLIRMLCAGEMIRGLNDGRPGTWHDLYRKVKPGHPVPTMCPWSTAKRNTPPGLSYQSFNAKKPEAAVMAGLNAGVGAMRNLLPRVRLDTSALEPLSLIVPDDKELDVLILHPTRTGWEVMGVNAVFWMCVATRRIVWASLHPEVLKPDGKRTGITQRDMQHGFAQMVRAFGIPKKGMLVRMEQATATWNESVSRMIESATGGLVKVRKTGTWDKSLSAFGFGERGGTPSGKAWLEAWMRILDLHFGFYPGQKGPRYQLAPGDLPRALQDAGRTLKSVGALATVDEVAKLVPQFMTLPALQEALMQTIDVIENDPLHDKQGFDTVRLWRNSPSDAWNDHTHPQIATLAEIGGGAAVNEFLTKLRKRDMANELICERKETVRERWDRLYDPANFMQPDPLVLWELMTDTFPAKYEGSEILAVNTRKAGHGWLEFQGNLGLAHRCNVTVRLDLDHPRGGAWVFGPDGKMLGHMALRERSSPLDMSGIQKQLAFKRSVGDNALKAIREVVDDPAALRRRMDALEQRASVALGIAEDATGGELTPSREALEMAASIRGEDEPDEDEDEGLTEFERQRYADDDE
jgi:hypothetical protein